LGIREEDIVPNSTLFSAGVGKEIAIKGEEKQECWKE